MNHMTDNNGTAWRVGDTVLRTDDHSQGIITEIVSRRMVRVRFPGSEHLMFVSGLWNITVREGV